MGSRFRHRVRDRIRRRLRARHQARVSRRSLRHRASRSKHRERASGSRHRDQAAVPRHRFWVPRCRVPRRAGLRQVLEGWLVRTTAVLFKTAAARRAMLVRRVKGVAERCESLGWRGGMHFAPRFLSHIELDSSGHHAEFQHYGLTQKSLHHITEHQQYLQ